MKLVKKWLFPALTCLIVAGGLVLPPYLSQLRDAGQFGQVHTELLAADALPAYEPPSLLDRLTLYARWHSTSETIPSFQSREEQYMEKVEQTMQEALNLLTEGGVIPNWLTEGLELTSWSYILLWNPEDSIASQNPIALWRVSAEFGGKSGMGSLRMDVDTETGLPLRLNIYDPNMAQWFSYKNPETLLNLAQGYFELLGLEAELIALDTPVSAAPWERLYRVAGLDLNYQFSFNATMLTIDIAGTSTSSRYGVYDR